MIEKILNFNIKSHISSLIKKANTPFFLSFITTFVLLNIIFLYHGTHFLFGDHDWRYLKSGIPLNAGLFEGRFAQFILVNLLSNSEIYPIINNFLGFLGFSLGLSLLAKYWQIPNTKASYITFSLFIGITPYILSFMYFAFLVIPCLSWNAFIIGALLLSSKEKTFCLKITLSSILLFTLALGGYPPVINLFLTALTTKIFLDLFYKSATLKTLIKDYRYTIINFILSAILYKLILQYFIKTGDINSSYYNLQTIPFSQYPSKFILITKDLFKQFLTTLPFITISYKSSTFAIVILATIHIIYNICKTNQKLLKSLAYIAIFYSALVTLFLSPSLKETEFSPRIDFFGLLYVYGATFAICLKSNKKYLKNLSILFSIFTILISTNSLIDAQKVWKLGFDTELNLYKRIEKRLNSNSSFNKYGHYIIVQGGSPSFRSRFYHEPHMIKSDDLLDVSYVPGMNSGVMLNYYTNEEYADTTSFVYTFRPDTKAKEFLSIAKPWPSTESISVGNYWIMLILNKSGLNDLRSRYL